MPIARNTDPKTSHDAAKSVSNVERTKEIIWHMLRILPSTDEQLVIAYNELVNINPSSTPQASESGIRSRRSELVGEGMIEDTGERAKTRSGRSAIIWRASDLVEGCE
jgi:hypothetical protein